MARTEELVGTLGIILKQNNQLKRIFEMTLQLMDKIDREDAIGEKMQSLITKMEILKGTKTDIN